MSRFFAHVAIVFSLCMTLNAFGQMKEFSADVVNTAVGTGTMTGKIYVSKDRSRMEMQQGVVISRMDKKVAWILMPGQKKYMEQAIDPRSAAGTEEKMPGEIERSLVGKETIDGRLTDKYRIVYDASGKKETVFQWMDPAINIPVKTAAQDNSWSTEYKNISIGSQPESLFEVPAGYEKFSMMAPGDLENMIQEQLPKGSLPQGE
jgi:hypothetical protein